MDYLIPLAAVAAFAIGFVAAHLMNRARVNKLRDIIAAKDRTLREYGRKIGEFRAERVRRENQRLAALANANARNRERHAAKTNGQTAIATK